MYINFSQFRSNESFGDGESMIRFPVELKPFHQVGHISFITDKNGEGYLEWCKGSTAKAMGTKYL